MVVNKHGYNVLAECEFAECTARINPREKYLYKGRATIELKETPRYGFQIILVNYMPKGAFPVLENPDYTIEYGRVENIIPSGHTLKFLKELRRNLTEAIKQVEAWERMRLIK